MLYTWQPRGSYGLCPIKAACMRTCTYTKMFVYFQHEQTEDPTILCEAVLKLYCRYCCSAFQFTFFTLMSQASVETRSGVQTTEPSQSNSCAHLSKADAEPKKHVSFIWVCWVLPWHCTLLHTNRWCASYLLVTFMWPNIVVSYHKNVSIWVCCLTLYILFESVWPSRAGGCCTIPGLISHICAALNCMWATVHAMYSKDAV